MRARFIYEKFTENSDPISDMNIGSFCKEIRFDNKNEVAQYIFDLLPQILNMKKIPKDILGAKKDSTWFKYPYYYAIQSYIDKYVLTNYGTNEIIHDVYKKIVRTKKYKRLDYNNLDDVKPHILYEKFTQDSDPIKDLGIGSIDLYEMYLKLVPEKNRKKYNARNATLHKKWLDFLLKTFTGRTVKFKRSLHTRDVVIKKITNVHILMPDQVFFYFIDDQNEHNYGVDIHYPVKFIK